jgi:hypothetical protein
LDFVDCVVQAIRASGTCDETLILSQCAAQYEAVGSCASQPSAECTISNSTEGDWCRQWRDCPEYSYLVACFSYPDGSAECNCNNPSAPATFWLEPGTPNACSEAATICFPN